VGPSSVVTPSSTVQVKGGSSSVVEVRGGTPTGPASKASVSAQPEVHEGPSGTAEVGAGASKILFSRVEVVGGDVPPSVEAAESHQDHQNEVPTIFSSVVEVRSSSEEPALSGNNIVEPEYDFLSRQPSEVVDETFKVSHIVPWNQHHHGLSPRANYTDRATVDCLRSYCQICG
jgi:hypothetical protein